MYSYRRYTCTLYNVLLARLRSAFFRHNLSSLYSPAQQLCPPCVYHLAESPLGTREHGSPDSSQSLPNGLQRGHRPQRSALAKRRTGGGGQGHLRDVEIDAHKHALACQRAVRHVGEGGLRSAALGGWGGVGVGAGLRLTLRWTLRTPHVRSAAGSRVARRPLPVAASMAMPSGQAQRYTQPGGRSGSTARTQARVAPLFESRMDSTWLGCSKNRGLVQHTWLCFATSRQPAFAQFPVLAESKSFSRTNLWRVAGARFLRLGPRQATLWHGRRHKPSYPPGAWRGPPCRARRPCAAR